MYVYGNWTIHWRRQRKFNKSSTFYYQYICVSILVSQMVNIEGSFRDNVIVTLYQLWHPLLCVNKQPNISERNKASVVQIYEIHFVHIQCCHTELFK